MPGSSASQSSFIPKRGPARRRKPKSKKQIFLFTIITYSLLFAALLAAAGTYFYKNYLTSQLQDEVTALNQAITTFSTADLARVHEFDVTLKRATDRIDHHASIVAMLDEIDLVTVDPVQISNLTIERLNDTDFELTGLILTSSFDAAMFQRQHFAKRNLFSTVQVTDVTIRSEFANTSGELLDSQIAAEGLQEVSFNVLLNVPLNEVIYDPAAVNVRDDESEVASVDGSESTDVSDGGESTDGVIEEDTI